MGVQIETQTPGDGANFPKRGDKVTVHYTGYLTDRNGKEFDSSRGRGRHFIFNIGMGEVIKAWDEGVLQMSIGQRAWLTCSPDYGYGAQGASGVIPPNAILCFDVELFKIN